MAAMAARPAAGDPGVYIPAPLPPKSATSCVVNPAVAPRHVRKTCRWHRLSNRRTLAATAAAASCSPMAATSCHARIQRVVRPPRHRRSKAVARRVSNALPRAHPIHTKKIMRGPSAPWFPPDKTQTARETAFQPKPGASGMDAYRASVSVKLPSSSSAPPPEPPVSPLSTRMQAPGAPGGGAKNPVGINLAALRRVYSTNVCCCIALRRRRSA